jgi:putative transposase
MMQAVGRRYVRYFNHQQSRSGTLWEGRYKSTLIQTENYLLVGMAYIDLNPVRAGIVLNARDYPWSSHAHYVGLHSDPLLTPHSVYWSLGNTPFAREAAYGEWVNSVQDAEMQSALTQATLHGWALGDHGFMDELREKTNRRIQKSQAGRPKQQKMS